MNKPFTFFRWFVAGAAIGTAAMYLLDPVEGKKRRTRIRHRGAGLKHDAFQLALLAQKWKNGANDFFHKISSAGSGNENNHSEHLESQPENPSYLH